MAAEKASGKGAAYDAGVITVDNTPEALLAAAAEAKTAAAKRFYREQVVRMEKKVEKQKEQLEAAEEALEEAESELAEQEKLEAKEASNGLD